MTNRSLTCNYSNACQVGGSPFLLFHRVSPPASPASAARRDPSTNSGPTVCCESVGN